MHLSYNQYLMSITKIQLLLMCTLLLLSCTSDQESKKGFISFDGTRIAYTDDGMGEPVLLIHGFIVDGYTNYGESALKKQLVNEGYRVLVPDLRGNGDSDKPQNEAAYKDDAEVKDLMALMNHIEADKYMAVGYSRGAIILANLLTKDDRITKAVFGGMGVHFTEPDWYRRIEFGNVFSGRSEPNEMTQGAVDYAKKSNADFKILGYLQDHQPETSITELNQIHIGTLVIAGDEDLDNGDPSKLKNQLPNSTLRIVSGDHMSTFNSKRFAEAIISFLEGNMDD